MIVKVFSTQMGEKEVTTDAKNWGELQNDLDANNVSYNKMKAVIGENKLTLEADGAVLPTEGFTLFLMNKKTKAGADVSAYSYKQLRATIKELVAGDGTAKDYFNGGGKNYTIKGTEILRALLSNYTGTIPALEDLGMTSVTPKVKKTPVKKVKAEKPKKDDIEETRINNIIEKAQKVVNIVKSVKENAQKISTTEEKEVNLAHFKDNSHISLDSLVDAISLLRVVNFSELDEDLHEDIEAITKRLEKKLNKATKIWTKQLAKEAKKAKKIKEKAAIALKEALAKEEAELKAKAEKEERKKAEAEEKKQNELNQKLQDMRSQFNDVR